MASICIEIRAGGVRGIYTKGLNARNVRIEVRDYDVEGIGCFGNTVWVDEYGDFLLINDLGSQNDLLDSPSPEIRKATEADYDSEQHVRASRFTRG